VVNVTSINASTLGDLPKIESRQHAVVADELKGDINESLFGFSAASLWFCPFLCLALFHCFVF
jgi:hypothetical protein